MQSREPGHQQQYSYVLFLASRADRGVLARYADSTEALKLEVDMLARAAALMVINERPQRNRGAPAGGTRRTWSRRISERVDPKPEVYEDRQHFIFQERDLATVVPVRGNSLMKALCPSTRFPLLQDSTLELSYVQSI